MTSLLNLDRNPDLSTSLYASPPPRVEPAPEAPQTVSPQTELRTLEEPGEFEIVLGQRQLASTSLVVIVLVAVLSAFSYLIGKSMAPQAVAATPMVQAAPMVQTPATPAPVIRANAPASPELPKAPVGAAASVITAPLFHEELAGKVYIQVAAVPRGFAGIWAEGLRTHGFDAFVAQGPNDVSWRVVIGPLADPQSFELTKRALDALNLDTFGRRHELQNVGTGDPHP